MTTPKKDISRERMRTIERETERNIRRIQDSVSDEEWSDEPRTSPTINVHVSPPSFKEKLSESLAPTPAKAKVVLIVSTVSAIIAVVFETLRQLGVLH